MARHSPFQLHSPVRVWTTRAVIAVLALIGGYLVYEFGRIQAGYNLVDAAGERQELEHRGHDAPTARGASSPVRRSLSASDALHAATVPAVARAGFTVTSSANGRSEPAGCPSVVAGRHAPAGKKDQPSSVRSASNCPPEVGL